MADFAVHCTLLIFNVQSQTASSGSLSHYSMHPFSCSKGVARDLEMVSCLVTI